MQGPISSWAQGRRLLLALVGAAIVLLVPLSASAQAKLPQTISFASVPPSDPVAGEAYAVLATSSAGIAVEFSIRGACSFEKPTPGEDEPLEREFVRKEAEQEIALSPTTVYFIAAGTCTIVAEASGNSEYEPPLVVSQSLSVAEDTSERLSFISSRPSDASVGETYQPTVRLSAGIAAAFSTNTPSVCAIESRAVSAEGETVSLLGEGRCTIAVRQVGVSAVQPPEAEQSFTVHGPASIRLIRSPRVDHESGALELEVLCSSQGTLSWKVTYSKAVKVFGSGATRTPRACPSTITVRPSAAALGALEQVRKHRHGLSVRAVLTFDPSSGAGPVSLERTIIVRLG